MRTLVLGAAGMLGLRVWRKLDRDIGAFATVRGSADDYASFRWFDARRVIDVVDVLSEADLDRAMSVARPDAAANVLLGERLA